MKKTKFFKMMKKIAVLILVLVTVLCFGMSTKVSAFGDYNDYDYDTGDDWGGGNDWGGGGWDSDDYGGNSYSSGDDDTDLGLFLWLVTMIIKYPKFAIPLIIIFVIVQIVRKGKKKNNNQTLEQSAREIPDTPVRQEPPRKQAPLKAKTMPDRTNEITEIIKETDPLFTTPDFISFVKDVYMDIQDAWCKRDLTPVRAVLHQNLYQRTQKQIDKKIADGIVNHLDRITVNNAYPTFYRRDEEYEYVTVYLVSQMIDYQVKEATGEVIYGDKSTRWTMCYLMTFMRSIDAKTDPAGRKDRGVVCPNCGAPLTGTSFGECAYCGTIVTTGAYDWVLSDFNVSRPETQDEGIVR